MASAKRTPRVSRISRDRTVAYARKQKPPAGGEQAGGSEADAPDPAADQPDKGAAERDAATARSPTVPPAAAVPPAATVPPAAGVEPWPDATPLPMKPADSSRVRVDTVAMPAQTSLGEPPAMPEGTAPAGSGGNVNVGLAEDPTRMPGPREIPSGHPDDPAPPPGHVPPGDSRSMRRRADQDEFALIYRLQTYVIIRSGKVGRRGQWRVVEYPTSASAGHAYAKECSRFVSEGFSDYRA